MRAIRAILSANVPLLSREDCDQGMLMTIWQRLLITLVFMVLASFIAGLVWRGMFDARIPSYISGLIGGVSALGIWELLRSRRGR